MVEPFIMVLTLLTIGAIPTVIGTSEALSAQKKKELEAKKSAKFHLQIQCSVKSRRRKEINNRVVVLRNNKVGEPCITPLFHHSNTYSSFSLMMLKTTSLLLVTHSQVIISRIQNSSSKV